METFVPTAEQRESAALHAADGAYTAPNARHGSDDDEAVFTSSDTTDWGDGTETAAQHSLKRARRRRRVHVQTSSASLSTAHTPTTGGSRSVDDEFAVDTAATVDDVVDASTTTTTTTPAGHGRRRQDAGRRPDKRARRADAAGAHQAHIAVNGGAVVAVAGAVQHGDSTGGPMRCVVCNEEQYYGSDEAMAGTSALDQQETMARVANGRELVFAYAHQVCGRVSEDVLCAGMLALRRRNVEAYLRRHNVRFTPWTMQMLRDHFCVDNNHRVDEVRELVDQLHGVRAKERWIERNALYEPREDDPTRIAANLKAMDTYVRLSKRRSEVIAQLHTAIGRRHSTPNEQRLVSTMRAYTATGGVGGGAAATMSRALTNADTHLSSVFDIGGLA